MSYVSISRGGLRKQQARLDYFMANIQSRLPGSRATICLVLDRCQPVVVGLRL